MESSWNKLKSWLGFDTKIPGYDDVTLSEILKKYQIVDVQVGTEDTGPFIVVTDRKPTSDLVSFADNPGITYPSLPTYPPVVTRSERDRAIQLKELPRMGEIGSSSPSPYTSFIRKEYNTDLEGIEGLKKYNKMRSDAVVAGTLLLFKTPVYAANWFVKPTSQDSIDKEIADFVWKALTEYMSITWTQIKTEAMLFCEFGYYMFEKVWEKRKIDGVNRLILKKLAPRHPMDVKEWDYDINGGPDSVTIYTEKTDGSVDEVSIPIEKLLVFTLNREANDITGRSLLRSMYGDWYYKTQLNKIDAIQKERHGIGVPVIKLPVNFTVEDKTAANELGRNLRTNERAHIVLPPMWEVLFAKLEGQPVNVIESIELHDKAIRESVLASFLSGGTTTKEEDVSLFLKATRYIADSICDAFNLYLLPELVRYNFGKDAKVPKLCVRRIGEQADWRVLGFAVRNFVGAGIITPDDALETAMREELDLPLADPATARSVQTPQAPQNTQQTAAGKADGSAGSTGLPRQTPVPTVGLPGGNAGNDKGGQS